MRPPYPEAVRVRFLSDPLGLYLHIPFCEKKCAYCDFYSAFAGEERMRQYNTSLQREILKWGGQINRPINTIYIGGGTPSLLGKEIIPLLQTVYDSFQVLPGSEITVEMNPARDAEEFLQSARAAGVNRLSIGAQTGNDRKLLLLGRTHTAADTVKTVEKARRFGFDNISLDLMLALPESDEKSVREDLRFITALSPQHISAYLLKIEANTRFAKIQKSLLLPDEEQQADQYLFACDTLKNKGYVHYEISNFAREGFESRHNLKYWQDKEYLGIGPSAHSFLENKRFYYPRDLKEFLQSPKPVDDGTGGSAEEALMLQLRLREGTDFGVFAHKFSVRFSNALPGLLARLCKGGLGILKNERFALTDRGMLVSNAIITEILECVYEDL